MNPRQFGVLLLLTTTLSMSACSSGSYKTQNYARLSNAKDFEEEFPVVWKAALAALADYKINEQDEEDGVIETDWVYSTSNEKYIEYRVNGLPRKKYLQNRYKLNITLEKLIEAVKVTVDPKEEVENLKSDGTSDGWKTASDIDTSRASEMIKNIELKILSRHE